jgi:hypothetical protein
VRPEACLRCGLVWGICGGNRSVKEATEMDYGKSGNPKLGKHEPHNKEGDKGPKKPAKAGRPSTDELLARMKAAAEAKKAG